MPDCEHCGTPINQRWIKEISYDPRSHSIGADPYTITGICHTCGTETTWTASEAPPWMQIGTVTHDAVMAGLDDVVAEVTVAEDPTPPDFWELIKEGVIK